MYTRKVHAAQRGAILERVLRVLLQCGILAGLRTGMGQNPNASRMLACQLWPAADKPPHALYSAMCRYCCKSPKLPGANFSAVKKTDRRPPIDVASITL